MDKNLLDYIQSARQQGLTDQTIKQNLITGGWQVEMIDDALMLNPQLASNMAQAGSTPRPTIAQASHPTLNSSFSVLLAIVLTVTLFVLTNNLISDIRDHYQSSITNSLIVQGFLIIPFLAVAFLLHLTIGENNRKFLILSRPYYIISGWLLIRLLLEVSKYLLDQNSTYGVYVVLILVVSVLTGMVIFIQKYLKH